jgi:hypothetical protein
VEVRGAARRARLRRVALCDHAAGETLTLRRRSREHTMNAPRGHRARRPFDFHSEPLRCSVLRGIGYSWACSAASGGRSCGRTGWRASPAGSILRQRRPVLLRCELRAAGVDPFDPRLAVAAGGGGHREELPPVAVAILRVLLGSRQRLRLTRQPRLVRSTRSGARRSGTRRCLTTHRPPDFLPSTGRVCGRLPGSCQRARCR